ncbi:hypothetical protein PVAP13_8KG249802 [Panicum virgatum]|uniref:Uncharacterized protein n=1 Tax=Panicum virgatum TaxID=38727 RepID=A0A8T0PNI0_PANVG|nr:hypothetical protein PVAP13_8KG249802 [Panicum virgatum]
MLRIRVSCMEKAYLVTISSCMGLYGSAHQLHLNL